MQNSGHFRLWGGGALAAVNDDRPDKAPPPHAGIQLAERAVPPHQPDAAPRPALGLDLRTKQSQRPAVRVRAIRVPGLVENSTAGDAIAVSAVDRNPNPKEAKKEFPRSLVLFVNTRLLFPPISAGALAALIHRRAGGLRF